MKFLALFLLPLAALAHLDISKTGPENFFSRANRPSHGSPTIWGSYSAGCIGGAVDLSQGAKNLTFMKPSRNRYYGHPALLQLLQKADREAPKPPKHGQLLIGDTSQPRGGPMNYGHASHQIGLDVDVWLTPQTILQNKTLAKDWRETLVHESVLDAKKTAVHAERWNPLFAEQILWFAGQGEVERIFVNALIKKKLCVDFSGDERLKKVRPWYFHDSHFHVRMACPKGQTHCVGQEAPKDLGCAEKDFEYWLSPEVRKEQEANPNAAPGVVKVVRLPEECRRLNDVP